LRSAPCRPRQSGGFLPRATQPPQQQSAARHASLWICGQHKSVAHKPTGPTATADNLNELKISRVRTTPGAPFKGSPQGDEAWVLRLLPPSIRGS
jgi:hypothetical protein